MHPLIWLVPALLVSLSLAPAAGQTRDRSACLERADRNTMAACGRFIEELSRTIRSTGAGKLSPKDRQHQLYDSLTLRGGAYQAMARRHAAGGDSGKATELHLRAIEDFDEAIRLDHKQQHAFLNRGSSLAELSTLDRAIQDFEQVLRVDPKNAIAFNNRGGAWRDKGNFDRAMADLNRAIALDPKLAHAFFNRGTVYLQKENYDLAIADYTAAMRHGSKDILTFAVRGGAWRDKGDYKRAKADFEAALALPAEDKRSAVVQEAVRELLRALQERAESERIEREEREQAERERIETERRARAEREAIEREQAERAKAEQAAQERAEQAARERAKLEKAARERAEWEKAAREKTEREKAGRERAKLENAAREQAERERVERERVERERAARERAEQTARDRAEKVARENEKREALERAKEQRRKAERDKARANRIALVIGNSVYRTLDVLDNPRNDANDVADMLDQLNFTVFRGIDLTHAETADMQARFKEAARRAEIAVFYFGGHGIQDGGVNYLAPVDADIGNLGSFLALQSVMHDLKSESGVRILMIDACRTSVTQEVASPQVAASRFVLLKRGLAPPEVPSGAEGRMFVVFATEPGEVASDGVGRNSPFARGLLKHLASPGLELRHLFVRVRSEVLRETGGIQNPHVDDRLKGEFVFKAGR